MVDETPNCAEIWIVKQVAQMDRVKFASHLVGEKLLLIELWVSLLERESSAAAASSLKVTLVKPKGGALAKNY